MVQSSKAANGKRASGAPASKTTTAARRTKPKSAEVAKTLSTAGNTPTRDIAKALERLTISGAAGALLEDRRKDLEALVQANKKSYEGLQAVVKRRTALLMDAIGEWQTVAKLMKVAGPHESIAKLDELGKGALKMALENIGELAELAAKSQSDALEIVKQRIRENVDEVSELLNRS